MSVTRDRKKRGSREEHGDAASVIEQLIEQARLYRSSKEFQDLMDFVVRLRGFAPFNALLLQIQRPGLLYAATASDWLRQFNRRVKPGARPLIILWPLSPVALVYEVEDTEGDPLPGDITAFQAEGKVNAGMMMEIVARLKRNHIETVFADSGSGLAGLIERRGLHYTKHGNIVESYRVTLNQNHQPAVQFATLAHELAHLFLGHLGSNRLWQVSDRRSGDGSKKELEAEAVAYLVCKRHGVTPNSHKYLSEHIKALNAVQSGEQSLDLYMITRAAGDVEDMLGLAPTIEVKDGVDTLGLRRRRRKSKGGAPGDQDEDEFQPIGGARSTGALAGSLAGGWGSGSGAEGPGPEGVLWGGEVRGRLGA